MPCLLNSLRSPSSMIAKWSVGVLDYWSVGVLERWSLVFDPVQYSTTPSLHFDLLPRQHAFLPRPDQSFDQQQQKDHHRHKRPCRQSGEGDGEGQEEDRFDVKNQKDDGIEVILGFELHPGVAFRFQAA